MPFAPKAFSNELAWAIKISSISPFPVRGEGFKNGRERVHARLSCLAETVAF
jgi:hypothetical protein